MTDTKCIFNYVCGSTGSGKTTYIIKYIKAHQKKYSNIVVLKTTNDFKEYKMKKMKKVSITTYSNELLYSLLKYMMLMKPSVREKRKLLIVLDDCIDFVNNKLIRILVFLRRHINVSVIVVSQGFKLLNSNTRNNISKCIFLRNTSENFYEFFRKNVSDDPRLIDYLKYAEYPRIEKDDRGYIRVL